MKTHFFASINLLSVSGLTIKLSESTYYKREEVYKLCYGILISIVYSGIE